MQLFYSHSSRQKPLVRELSELLGKKYSSWIDEDRIKLGDGLGVRIANGISDDVDIFILLLCRDAAKADWVKKEVAWAQGRESKTGEKIIFVVLLDREVIEEEQWTFVKEKKYLELASFEKSDVEALAKKLNEQILSFLIDSHNNRRQPQSLVTVVERPPEVSFVKWLQTEALADLAVELDETIVERKLSDVFVCPPLTPIGEVETPSDELFRSKERRVKIDELITGNDNWMIFIHPEFGQTSLARHLAYRTLIAAAQLSKPRLPTIIDAARWQRTSPYENDFLRMLRRGSPDNLPKKREVLLAGC